MTAAPVQPRPVEIQVSWATNLGRHQVIGLNPNRDTMPSPQILTVESTRLSTGDAILRWRSGSADSMTNPRVAHNSWKALSDAESAVRLVATTSPPNGQPTDVKQLKPGVGLIRVAFENSPGYAMTFDPHRPDQSVQPMLDAARAVLAMVPATKYRY